MLKKLLSISRYRDNRELQPWIKSICNHLWFCCVTCGSDPDELIIRWKPLLHHICGVHTWTEDGKQQRCLHSELSPDQQRKKKWLKGFPSLQYITNPCLRQESPEGPWAKHPSKHLTTDEATQARGNLNALVKILQVVSLT